MKRTGGPQREGRLFYPDEGFRKSRTLSGSCRCAVRRARRNALYFLDPITKTKVSRRRGIVTQASDAEVVGGGVAGAHGADRIVIDGLDNLVLDLPWDGADLSGRILDSLAHFLGPVFDFLADILEEVANAARAQPDWKRARCGHSEVLVDVVGFPTGGLQSQRSVFRDRYRDGPPDPVGL